VGIGHVISNLPWRGCQLPAGTIAQLVEHGASSTLEVIGINLI